MNETTYLPIKSLLYIQEQRQECVAWGQLPLFTIQWIKTIQWIDRLWKKWENWHLSKIWAMPMSTFFNDFLFNHDSALLNAFRCNYNKARKNCCPSKYCHNIVNSNEKVLMCMWYSRLWNREKVVVAILGTLFSWGLKIFRTNMGNFSFLCVSAANPANLDHLWYSVQCHKIINI